MNILFSAINVDIKSRTGDAVHVRELACNLAMLGNHVSLIAGYSPEQSNELQSLEKYSNIEISYKTNIFKMPFPRSRDLSSLWLCLKIARRTPLDVIYERSCSPKIGVVLSKILRIPLVVEINGIVEDEAKSLGTHIDHKYTSKIRKKFRELLFKSANKIVAVTPGIKEELQNKYHIPPDKIVVIPNGANTNIFIPMDQKTVKEELGLNQENKYVCFVGNLAPWQGLEYIIKAAPIVLEDVPEARFLIVGDGVAREELENMVEKKDLQDKFVFAGSVPFEVVPKYINASYVCVAPFLRNRKCSPIKVFEYLACKKPVIISDIGRDVELFLRSNFLVVVSPEDHIKLANAVIMILNNDNIHITDKNEMEDDVDNYSWNSTAKKVMKLCGNL